MRDDRPGDLRDAVEDVPHVEGSCKGRREGLQTFVLAASLPFVRREALMLERHRHDVGDRPEKLLVLRGVGPRLEAQKGKVASPRAAGERYAEHRPDLCLLETAVSGKGRVENQEEIRGRARAREQRPEAGRVLVSRDMARVGAAFLVVQGRAGDRVQGNARALVVVRHGHRVESEDARGRGRDALEHDVEVQTLARDAGDLREDRDEGGRSRLHGRAF